MRDQFKSRPAIAVAGPLVLVLTASCASRALRVGVVFENGWTLGNETLTESDRSIVAGCVVENEGGFTGQAARKRLAAGC